jgi:hypothetical protein
VFNGEVLGRLDAALNSAGATMRDAGSKLMRDKAAAEADLARARANVENARKDVEAKLKAFNDAKAKVGFWGSCNLFAVADLAMVGA